MKLQTMLFPDDRFGLTIDKAEHELKKDEASYREAVDANQAMMCLCDRYLEKCKHLDEQDHYGVHPRLVVNALLDMEAQARKALSAARDQGERMREEALHILEEAQREADELQAKTKKMGRDDHVDKAEARLVAQMIIDEANSEAAEIFAQAKQRLEQARASAKETLNVVQSLLVYIKRYADHHVA